MKVPEHLNGVVNRYHLRPTTPLGVNGDSWSLWLLDQNMGALCIVSDYGNWSHVWGRAGLANGDFRREILRFGGDYIGRKLRHGVSTVFKADLTVQAIRGLICQQRREGDISWHEARTWYDGVERVTDMVELSRFFDDHEGTFERFYESPVYDVEDNEWLNHLMTVTLPRLKEAIRAELEAEKGRAA